jgi:WD40 repeat protein
VTGYRLGVDFGTSNTVAVLGWPDERVRPLLFDGVPVLSSAVYADGTGRILVGREADRSARIDPTRFERNPKRRIDELDVLLGDQVYPVAALFTAVLSRVAVEAVRTAGEPPGSVTLTCPAAWGPARRKVLIDGATAAGLPGARVLPEPVAAAAYFVAIGKQHVPVGGSVVVYDLGGGTFDASVVRRTQFGFETLAYRGLDDFGGVDLDALVVDAIGRVLERSAPDAWLRVTRPTTPGDRRQFLQLWDDARSAKETLSRHPSAALHVPIVDSDVHVTREEFEQAARPALARTVEVTQATIREARVRDGELAGLFLVGGSTRIPLVATLLHQGIGITPTVLEQPEIVVAEGALCVPARGPEPVTAAAAGGVAGRPGDSPVARVAVQSAPARLSGGAAPPLSTVDVAVAPPPALPAPPAPIGMPGPVEGTRPGATTRRLPDRRTRIVAAAVALVLLIGAGAGIAIWFYRPGRGGAAGLGPAAATGSSTSSANPSGDPSANPSATPSAAASATQARKRTATVLGRVTAPAEVWSVALSLDGTRLATGGDDGSVRIWNVASRQQVGSPLTGHTARITDMTFSADGQRLVTASSDRTSRVWNLATGQSVVLAGHTDGVAAAAFSPDGGTVATASTDKTVRLWNASSGAQIGAPLTGHTGWVVDVAFSTDGRTLASASYDHSVRLWNVSGRTPIGGPLSGHTDKVYQVAFSPDGATVASAGQDKTLRLWSLVSHTQIGQPLRGHTQWISTVAFSPDGATVGTSSFDGTARLWDVASRQQSQLITGGFAANTVAAFSRDLRMFAGVGAEPSKTVTLWRIS